ncbi:MAG TPA: FCD domain-containing protein [Steroidobacteraceae bacterium]|nr:FCD domain-containing protein [Steroidobacteraceae bacterium]
MGFVTESDKELSLVHQGYQTLRRRIIRGEYPPGAKLRIEALQQSLHLSSSPLREALNRLAVEGLVDADDGRGFRAARVSHAELIELTDLRVLLEGDALRRAVTQGDDEWEGRVVSAAHKLRLSESRSEGDESGPLDVDDWADRHRQFHLALLSGSGYPRLVRLCENLFDQAERYRRVARLSSQPRKKAAEHRKLEEAALSRDADSAVELLTGHIRKTAARVLEVLRDSEELAGQPGT